MTDPTATAEQRAAAIAQVIDFWRQAGPAKWFAKDPAFDDDFRRRFADQHDAAADGRLDEWADSAEGCLAFIILLDQFPRNCFRGTARSFATDDAARALADKAVDQGFDTTVDASLRAFLYLPFMHCEDIGVQDLCVALCEEIGDPQTTRFAIMHRDIIARFGRFPHRNAIVGRQSTDEELAFLESGGFGG